MFPLFRDMNTYLNYMSELQYLGQHLLLHLEHNKILRHNYYSSKKWGEAKSYDLCIDSGEVGIDGAIDLIVKYIELKEKHFNK